MPQRPWVWEWEFGSFVIVEIRDGQAYRLRFHGKEGTAGEPDSGHSLVASEAQELIAKLNGHQTGCKVWDQATSTYAPSDLKAWARKAHF